MPMSIAEFLSTVKGFDGIQWDDLQSLADEARLNTYAPGRNLMRAGEPGDTMHVIRSGLVKVPIVDESNVEKMVFHLGPGELVVDGGVKAPDVGGKRRLEPDDR